MSVEPEIEIQRRDARRTGTSPRSVPQRAATSTSTPKKCAPARAMKNRGCRRRRCVEAADAPKPQRPGRGGDSRPQVVLKIRRRKFKRAFKAGEIAVTRRLFRSGESEYLLNGKLCRLRDIQDIFMGTGLGPESYAIIEQGRIGQILSSKPTDRRAIIEEAAGITKFKTRKRLAEARLEDAKQNLARINDIFDEVTRQMNSLKRQAAKAERYAKLRDEMRAKLRIVLASKFAQLDAEAAHAGAATRRSWRRNCTRKTEAVQSMDAEHGERTQRGYAIEREGQENREKLNKLALEMDRAAARRRTNEERCAELDARSAGAQAEIGSTEEQLAALARGVGGPTAAMLESASADVAGAQQELQQRQQEAAAGLERADGGGAPAGAAPRRRFCKPYRRHRRSATASRRRKSASPPWTAKPSVCKRRPTPRISNWRASADSAARSDWSSSRHRSGSTRIVASRSTERAPDLDAKRAAESRGQAAARFPARANTPA